MFKTQIKENWLWCVMWAGFIFTAIYSRPLIPIDETRYLSVAWEMWHNNNFLVPHINGLAYSQKPPLLFWIIHLFWWVFGVGEWSGRLVAPLFGFGAVLLTIHCAKVLWPAERQLSRNVPFILFGMGIWLIYSSLTMFDTLLTFICLAAFLAILKAAAGKTFLPWLWLSIAVGLGLLAKGPVVLVYVLPPILLVPWWGKGDKVLLRRWYGFAVVSLAAGIGIALCWAIPAARAGGAEYGQAILFGQTAGRMVHSFAHARPFYWYALLLPLLLFPWIFWFPLWQGLKHHTLDRGSRFCLSIFCPAFIVLSCISGKQIHYFLPMLPAAALLLARISSNVTRPSRFDRIVIILIYVVFGVALFILPHLQLHGGDRAILATLPKWIWLVPLLPVLFLVSVRPCSPDKSLRKVFVSVLLLVTLAHFMLSGSLNTMYSQKEIGDSMHQVQKKGGNIAILPGKLKDQFQFSGRLTRPLFPFRKWSDLATWTLANPEQFCLIFTRSSDYEYLKGPGIVRPYNDGWLIFRPAKDFLYSYQAWVVNKTD